MLVIRGVNVFPSEIEAVLLDDEAVGGQYRILVDRRGTMPQLIVQAELVTPDRTPERAAVTDRLARRLEERLRVRPLMEVGDPGSIPRQDVGKARRVWEISADEDLPPALDTLRT
jgi:phenylacetate-CoA ligase